MTYKSKFLFAASLIAGWALTALPALGQAPVVVTNTTAHPVPVVSQGTTTVSGTVSIGNTPAVAVASMPSVNIAGTPTVNVAPGGSMNVANVLDGENNPKPLAVLEAMQPYEDECGFGISSPSNYGNCHFQPIPAGKRLVIEEVDVFGYNDTGIKPVQVSLNPAGYVNHNFAITYLSSSWGHDNFATHQQTRLYSPATAQPQCGVTLSGYPVSGTYYCSFSGFLVDTQ